MPEKITEEMGVHKQWYEEAHDMTADRLPEFIRKLTEDYQHDYGTICHAVAAAAVAGAWSVERSPCGGITGFQAGAIMWEFMRHWNHVKGPARLLDYNDLLYPQYENKFRTISDETWQHIKDQARKNLDENGEAHPAVVAHWQSIMSGEVPFGLAIGSAH